MSASLPVAILWQATLNILQSARQSVTCHMWHLITVFISNCLQQYYTDKVISVVVTRYVAPDILLSHANLVNVIPAPCPWSRSRLLLLTNINTPVSPWSPVTTNTTKEEQREKMSSYQELTNYPSYDYDAGFAARNDPSATNSLFLGVFITLIPKVLRRTLMPYS